MPPPPIQIDPIETDILGDFARDDHSLFEIFDFVRGHQPHSSDSEVFTIGRQILASWVQRGWLQLAGDGAMWGAARGVVVASLLVDLTLYAFPPARTSHLPRGVALIDMLLREMPGGPAGSCRGNHLPTN